MSAPLSGDLSYCSRMFWRTKHFAFFSSRLLWVYAGFLRHFLYHFASLVTIAISVSYVCFSLCLRAFWVFYSTHDRMGSHVSGHSMYMLARSRDWCCTTGVCGDPRLQKLTCKRSRRAFHRRRACCTIMCTMRDRK
jgi:hypothetical protein